MKHWMLAFLGSVAAFAQAPASIAGKIYRDSWIFTGARSSGEMTLVLGTDGRFSLLKVGGGGALILNAPYKIFLSAPRPDGSYTYTRTGESTATLGLVYGDGTTDNRTLTFASAAGGIANGFYSFWLTDPVTAQTAPANNLSMRGRISPGHPLIVGFIVPGDASATSPNLSTPPPGIIPREVLIRAVGPSLTAFNVSDLWADPDFQLYRGSAPATVTAAHYGDWCVPVTSSFVAPTPSPDTEAAYRRIFSYVGAFPLLSGSKDAADVVRLNPGAYTIVCTAAPGDAGGEALVEVYFLP